MHTVPVIRYNSGITSNEDVAMRKQNLIITPKQIAQYAAYLREQERAEAVQTGRAEVSGKGKRRSVFLPDKLRTLLRHYLQTQKITAGAVFVSRNGKPLDRSSIWRDMKALCARADVAPGKVFPHNLRHLFARMFYSLEKDLSRLADILGHTNVSTTRIYTAESGAVHARQIGRLGLVVT